MSALDESWVEELRRQAQADMFFAAIQDKIDLLQPNCMRIIEKLPPDQQGMMEQYLRLMEQMEVWMTHHAYICGVQVGERRCGK